MKGTKKQSTPDHTEQNKNHHGVTTDTGISSLASVVQRASKDATGAQDKHPSVIFKNAARVQVAKVTAINTEGIWPRIQGWLKAQHGPNQRGPKLLKKATREATGTTAKHINIHADTRMQGCHKAQHAPGSSTLWDLRIWPRVQLALGINFVLTA